MKQLMLSVLVITMALWLTACGGSRGSLHSPALDLTDAIAAYEFSKSAYQHPNYEPVFTLSPIGFWGNTVTLGGDVEPREWLRPVASGNGITYSMGASRDGVGVDRLTNYKFDLHTRNGTTTLASDGFYPFRVRPTVLFDAELQQRRGGGQDAMPLISYAIDILNDALPSEFQLMPDYTNVSGMSRYDEGVILVRVAPESQIAVECPSGVVACAGNDRVSLATGNVGYTRRAQILLPDTFDLSKPQTALTVVLHEFLHALGIQGHVDSFEFPDSLMGKSGDFFPNPGYILHRIDREALQIMYMSQRTTNYNDWAEWSDTTLHLVGRSDDEIVNFGVALFNGLPQPWARGPLPAMTLFDNPPYLHGAATWTGVLLGFSGVSPVAGDAALTVDLNRLDGEHALQFRDLYFVNRFEESGPERWFPERNLDYAVELTENFFTHLSDDGVVTGTFTSERHEGMVGTLQRTDLVGAFGGSR